MGVPGLAFSLEGRCVVEGRVFPVPGRVFSLAGLAFSLEGRWPVEGRAFSLEGCWPVEGRAFSLEGRCVVEGLLSRLDAPCPLFTRSHWSPSLRYTLPFRSVYTLLGVLAGLVVGLPRSAVATLFPVLGSYWLFPVRRTPCDRLLYTLLVGLGLLA